MFSTSVWAALCKTMSLGICSQWRPNSACASVQADQDLRCLRTESLDTIEWFCGEQIPRWDCVCAWWCKFAHFAHARRLCFTWCSLFLNSTNVVVVVRSTYQRSSYPLSCWTLIYPAFANSVEPDQLASEEANWSGCALFVIKYVNL